VKRKKYSVHMERHTILQQFLDLMLVDETSFKASPEAHVQLNTMCDTAFNCGLSADAMLRFTVFTHEIVERAGLTMAQLRHRDAQTVIRWRAILSNFSIDDKHTNETISLLRQCFNLPLLQ
jgi:hypothetical protein